MKIVLGLSRADISAVRELKDTADASVRYLRRKQNSDEGLTRRERKGLKGWLQQQKIFNRIVMLATNEMAADDTRKTGELSRMQDEVIAMLTGMITAFKEWRHQSDKEWKSNEDNHWNRR